MILIYKLHSLVFLVGLLTGKFNFVNIQAINNLIKAMKRTYQPKTRQRARKCGFRVRMRKAPHVLKNRRNKKRQKLAVA